MLLAALGSVRIGKNCDLGLENAMQCNFNTSVTVFPYMDLPAGQQHISVSLNALCGYYFARVENVLAQFRIKCLNFATGNENVNW